jgi:hypothetical protein
MKWKLTWLLALILVTGCVPTGGAIDPCAGWKPILLTGAAIDALTVEEAAEVLAHNEFGAARCGWGG